MGTPNSTPKVTQFIKECATLNGPVGSRLKGRITTAMTTSTNTAYNIPIRYLLKAKNFTLGNSRKKSKVNEKAIK